MATKARTTYAAAANKSSRMSGEESARAVPMEARVALVAGKVAPMEAKPLPVAAKAMSGPVEGTAAPVMAILRWPRKETPNDGISEMAAPPDEKLAIVHSCCRCCSDNFSRCC